VGGYDGPEPGERVVVAGVHKVKDGQLVNLDLHKETEDR
jgi:hypothetical protein